MWASTSGCARLKASTLVLADGANLDLSLHLYDSLNNHVAGQDSDATLDASLTASVSAAFNLPPFFSSAASA